MQALIGAAAALVATHPGLAVAAAFAGSVVEAVAVLGLVVPGTPILMAVAGAAALARMSTVPILLAAIAGAVLGDGISFWLGAHYRDRFRRVWPFIRRPGLLAEAERFFARYGGHSVALARFMPVLRSTVPLVVGMAGMPARRFLAANIVSAAVWAPAHVYAVQLGAFTVRAVAADDWRAVMLVAATLAAPAAAFVLLRRGGFGSLTRSHEMRVGSPRPGAASRIFDNELKRGLNAREESSRRLRC